MTCVYIAIPWYFFVEKNLQTSTDQVDGSDGEGASTGKTVRESIHASDTGAAGRLISVFFSACFSDVQ